MSKIKKIVIVEDDTILSSRLADVLEAEGYKTFTEENGEEGLNKIRTESPDLIVLDIMLPGLDGLALCRQISRDTTTSHIPIIMITARAMDADKIVGLESGADDYLVKPFSLGEFLARVRARIRRLHNQVKSTDELVSDGLTLNLVSRRANKDGTTINLTNTEFELLAEFMRNPNAVLSRDLLLLKVWGYDSFIDTRTVDVHVRWLRQKIELDPSDPKRITTIRGVGYRFEK